jgi:hypothetical protein
MNNLNFRYYNPKILLSTIVLLAIGLFLLNQYLKSHWGLGISFAVLSLSFVVINNSLWNVRPFKWMYVVPDISGRYEGTLKYTYKNEKCEIISDTLQHIKIIKQNGSRVSVRSFTRDSTGKISTVSVSLEASIIKESDGSYSLLHSYYNKGSIDLTPHLGTEFLSIQKINTSIILSGRYFTERIPYGTKGEINLTFKGKKFNDEQ